MSDKTIPEQTSATVSPASLSRRHFLAATSVGASSLALTSCGGIAGDATATSPLPVAYASGSDKAQGLTDRLLAGNHPASELAALVPAERMAGDGALAEQGKAWITIHGLYGADVQPTFQSLFLSANLSGRIPFAAWGHAADTVPRISAPTTFRVPLAPGQAVSLGLTHKDSKAGSSKYAVTLGGGGGRELRTGVYVIALDEYAWTHGASGRLANVQFPYVVVSVSATDPRVS